MNQRIIIPFFHNKKIVGYTGRFAGKPPKDVPRYLNSELPGNFLFNSNVMTKNNRKFIILVEGPFDAIAIDGVAALGSTLNKNQIAWLNAVDKEIIVLPDREAKNQDLIDCAIEQKWSVSFPSWEKNIKDAADASKIYGKLYTIFSVIKSRTNSELQIKMKRQLLKG
jgi:DNA primase